MMTMTSARRTIKQWVHKYNEQGIIVLKDKPRPGTPTVNIDSKVSLVSYEQYFSMKQARPM